MGRTRCFRKVVFEGSSKAIGSRFCSGQGGEPYALIVTTIKNGTFRILNSNLFAPFAIGSLFASARPSIYSLIRGFPLLEAFRFLACAWVVLVHRRRHALERG